MALLRYLLNELLDEDGDGIPDQRRGIPRAPGMSLSAPSADGRMDDMLGIDQPDLDDGSGDPSFDASPLDAFLERFSAGGVPQGMQAPQGFGQGLLSGLAQGAVGRGQRVGERRKKFEATQVTRAAERDKANLAATQKYRDRVVEGKAGLAKEGRDEARKQREYERTVADRIPPKTPAQLEEDAFAGAMGRNRADERFPKPTTGRDERLVAIEGPSGPTYVRESEALGRTPAKGSREGNRPPSAGEREQLTGDIGLLGQINDVRAAYRPEFVGPASGRYGGVSQKVGLGLTRKGEANFRGRLSAIRNQILKLRSGGAVTEGEAQRLLEELPIPTDPSEGFEAKMDAFESMVRNVSQARREVMQGTGVDVSRVPALPPARTTTAKATLRYNPATGKLEPIGGR